MDNEWHSAPVHSISISANREKIISGSSDKKAIIWDFINKKKEMFSEHSDIINAVDITANGKFAISGSRDTRVIYRNLSSYSSKTIIKHKNWVNAVCITPDNRWAISGSEDKRIILYNIQENYCSVIYKHSSPINCIAMTHDAKHIIFGSNDNNVIYLKNIEGEILSKSFKGHSGRVNSLSITPDAKFALSGSSDNTVILWDLRRNIHKTFYGHTSQVTSISITPDAKFAISGSNDKSIILWNLVSSLQDKEIGHELKTKLHTENITKKDKQDGIINLGENEIVSPDRKTRIKSNEENLLEIEIFNNKAYPITKLGKKIPLRLTIQLDDGTEVSLNSPHLPNSCYDHHWRKRKLSIPKYRTNDAITVLVIKPSGKELLSGSEDGKLYYWILDSNTEQELIGSFSRRINAIEIIPDGKRAVCGLDNGEIVFINLINNKEIGKFPCHSASIKTLIISNNGRYLLSYSNDGILIIWDITKAKPIGFYKNNLSIKQVKVQRNYIVLIDELSVEHNLEIENQILLFPNNLVLIRQIWDFEFKHYLPLSADCPLCGHRFSPPTSVIETINKITSKYKLKPEQSPCLELPDEAWEEPGLLSECPQCGEELKFNPFIAGGEEY